MHCTEELVGQLLDDDISFLERERECREDHNRNKTCATRDYALFVDLEVKAQKEALLKEQAQQTGQVSKELNDDNKAKLEEFKKSWPDFCDKRCNS